jgi:YebC/PmpR family DNA-binding regulatory protein
MAGHSKWANIKHRKAAQDAKRGKIFTKIIRELVVESRQGGAEIMDNPGLRQTVDKALAANMKRDTIDKAIQRGAGGTETENYDELIYEGYGVGGVAILVKCLTDNVNRTVSQVRSTFAKAGGSLSTSGSVSYLFKQRGQLFFTADTDEYDLIEAALDAGADDIISHTDGSFEVLTEPKEFIEVKMVLHKAGFIGSGEITMLPSTSVTLKLNEAGTIMDLVNALEELDDVQDVYTNADIPTNIIEELLE